MTAEASGADPTPYEEEDGKPKAEPKTSGPWLALITRAKKAGFDAYNDRCDKIDKQYASADRLASQTRDAQFQIFWANVQVLGPSIYSRPPVPVVVPRFRDRRPLPRTTSELLERATIVLFEQEDIDAVMKLDRDDLVVLSRGAAWLRYETKGEEGKKDYKRRVCIEHVARRDFLHDPARNWKEVDWVAKRSWLTKKDMRKRFREHSGDAYKDAAFEIRKDENDNDDGKLKAGVWELWCKSANKVVWVTEGVEKLLDEGEPHLDLEGFFPCPRPAYGTTQRGDLIPVPDFVYYQDQVSEINALTNRITALTEAVKIRAFYPAGAGEIGDALETALAKVEDNAVFVPISNWGLVGNGTVKDMLVWLPIDMIVAAIEKLVELRKQLIDDVYQITGLSDIMRGSTEPSETLGAQELKTQYGQIRVKDRQDEMVRLARDITRIACEIMAENYTADDFLAMTQMEIPRDADIQKQVSQIEAQIKQALADPQIRAMAEQQPEKAQQVLGQAQQQIAQLKDTPTIEKCVELLRDQRLRPFVLDIETDSTIAPDENAQKQRATEYVTALTGLIGQAEVVQRVPQMAPVFSEVIKFVNSQFRVGREVQQTVDEFADQMKQFASQPRPDPEAAARQAETQMKQQELQGKMQVEQAKIAADKEMQQIEAQAKQQENQAKMAEIQAKMEMERQKGELELKKLQMEIEAKGAELQIKRESAQIDAAAKAQQAAIQTSSAQQQADISARAAEQKAIQSDRAFEQKSALAAQQAKEPA